jgi:hypothetical protein
MLVRVDLVALFLQIEHIGVDLLTLPLPLSFILDIHI